MSEHSEHKNREHRDRDARETGAAPEQEQPSAPAEAREPGPDADERAAALAEENAQLRERALRALAEAENARKRAERDSAAAREYAIERFAADLLGVADNLARALASIPPEARGAAPEAARTLLEGVELTQRELARVFERHKILTIDPKGEPFDPHRHQAVAQFPSDIPAGHVAEVMQTGYILGDRVLRAAMVAVSAGPGAGGANGGDAAGAQNGGARGGQADMKI